MLDIQGELGNEVVMTCLLWRVPVRVCPESKSHGFVICEDLYKATVLPQFQKCLTERYVPGALCQLCCIKFLMV